MKPARVGLGHIGLGRSLRGRLTLSMALILCGALSVVAMLHELEDRGGGLGGRLGRLLLGDELPEPFQDLAVLVPFGALVLVLIGTVCSWSLRPLVRASVQAAGVGPGDPGRRIDAEGLPSELSPLVAAVNAALDRLAGAYERERRFTMNAAHELRTPLATLSLRLQRTRHDGTVLDWPAIERDIAAMSERIDRLLDLARKEGERDGLSGQAWPVLDLCRPVRAAAAQMLPLIEEAGRTLSVELPESLKVRGDQADLQDMVRNLVENALSHGRGRITLRACAGRDGARQLVLVEVGDEGPGVAPSLRTSMFERFQKGTQNQAGSGLGLAIVREVAHRHRGSVGFLDAPRCVVRVVLPASR